MVMTTSKLNRKNWW